MSTDDLVTGAGAVLKSWNISDNKTETIFRIPPGNKLLCLEWSQSNTVIAAGLASGCLHLISRKSKKSLGDLSVKAGVSSVSFLGRSGYIAVGDDDGKTSIFDIKKRTSGRDLVKIFSDFKDVDAAVTCVRSNKACTHLTSSGSNGRILVHRLDTGRLVGNMGLPETQAVKNFMYSPFVISQLSTANDDGSVIIWDVNEGKSIHRYQKAHSAPCTEVCYSPINDTLLASSGLDKRIVLFDVRARKTIRAFSGEGPITTLSIHENGEKIAFGSATGRVVVYDMRAKAQVLSGLASEGETMHPVISVRFPGLSQNTAPTNVIIQTDTSIQGNDALESSNGADRDEIGAQSSPTINEKMEKDDSIPVFSPVHVQETPAIKAHAQVPLTTPSLRAPFLNMPIFTPMISQAPQFKGLISQKPDSIGVDILSPLQMENDGDMQVDETPYVPRSALSSYEHALSPLSSLLSSPISPAFVSNAPNAPPKTPSAPLIKNVVSAKAIAANVAASPLSRSVLSNSVVSTPAVPAKPVIREQDSISLPRIVPANPASPSRTRVVPKFTPPPSPSSMHPSHYAKEDDLQSNADFITKQELEMVMNKFGDSISKALVENLAKIPTLQSQNQSSVSSILNANTSDNKLEANDFQVGVIKSIVEQGLDEFKSSINRDIQGMLYLTALHLDVIKQFHRQQRETEELLRKQKAEYIELIQELSYLLLENERLKQIPL